MTRPSWEVYFLQIAHAVSARASCSRAKHGAVIVNDADKRIVATGYNGARSGDAHCDHSRKQVIVPEVGVYYPVQDLEQIDSDMRWDPLQDRFSCLKARHAEENAIDYLHRTAEKGPFTMYVTGTPCPRCANQIANENIKRVVWDSEYRPDMRALDTLIVAGINISVLEPVA